MKLKNKFRKLLLPVCLLILVLSMSIALTGCSSGGGSHSTNRCKSCGRSWEAGDSGGNFMSIARTNMCKNCYNNFKWAQDALGK